jgi:hypothetical protein
MKKKGFLTAKPIHIEHRSWGIASLRIPSPNSYQMPFSKIELADTVGYSKESVINCLSSLHSNGIITVSG